MRLPDISLTRTHAALEAWLEAKSESDAAWDGVVEAYLFVDRLLSAQPLHQASRELVALAKPTAGKLSELRKTAATLAELAQSAKAAEDARRARFKVVPGMVDASSVIFDGAEIDLVERVQTLCEMLEAALSAATGAISRPRRQPSPQTQRAGKEVLLELVKMLRDYRLEWTEIGGLVIDDYDSDRPKRRGERYRQLLRRTSGGQ